MTETETNNPLAILTTTIPPNLTEVAFTRVSYAINGNSFLGLDRDLSRPLSQFLQMLDVHNAAVEAHNEAMQKRR